jgi:hypothetical protein
MGNGVRLCAAAGLPGQGLPAALTLDGISTFDQSRRWNDDLARGLLLAATVNRRLARKDMRLPTEVPVEVPH